MPAGELFFLTPESLRESCGYVGLPEEVAPDVIAGGRRIAAGPALTALAWHERRLLGEHKTNSRFWLAIAQALGDHAGMLHLIVLLSFIPETRKLHEARGIPREIVLDTMSDFLLCMKRYRALHGVWGVADMYAGGWLQNHITGVIYRLGRLQFIPAAFRREVVAFRHRASGAVAALVKSDREFRRDGYPNGAGGVTETEGLWRATFAENDAEAVGHPVDPARGCALPRPVRLARAEWDRALAPGEPTLDIHIPAGPPLAPEACRESLVRATEFFPRHFPGKPFKAFVCGSWLFDAQLEQYLPPTSNLVRFLSEFYLLPATGGRWSALRFVFQRLEGLHGGVAIPEDAAPESMGLKDFPRRTTLERAILEHIERGGHWRATGALLLVEDLPKYGTQAYRKQRHPW